MVFYALIDVPLQEAVDFYPSLDDAELALRQALRDEPQWEGNLEVQPIEFPTSLN